MRSKLVASLLGILFGTTGIPRFYTGQVALGIFKLLIFWVALPALLVLNRKQGIIEMVDGSIEVKVSAFTLVTVLGFIISVLTPVSYTHLRAHDTS